MATTPDDELTLFVFRVLNAVPFVPDSFRWTATPGNWTLVGLLLLTAFGLSAARRGQPLFGRILPE